VLPGWNGGAALSNAVVNELVEISGIVAAIRLCRHFKGRAVYVPEHMHETHPIALIIGIEAALKLSARWGGDRIAIPAESVALVTARNLQIAEAYRTGTSISELARDYGYSRAGILRILDQAGVERRQE
jgi:hypothetical protein